MERKRNEFFGSRAATSALDLNENHKIQIGNGKVISFYFIFIFLFPYNTFKLSNR